MNSSFHERFSSESKVQLSRAANEYWQRVVEQLAITKDVDFSIIPALSRRKFLLFLLVAPAAVAARTNIVAAQEKSNYKIEAKDQGQELLDSLWNAGGVIVSTDSGYGQGYLVRTDQGMRLHTIEHVIANQEGYVTLYIPYENDKVMRVRNIPIDQFQVSDRRTNDHDTSVYFELEGSLLDELQQSAAIGTIVRGRVNETIVGQWVASPRPDTGKWTIYEVTEFDEAKNRFIMKALFGNHCEGRSGAPLLVVDRIVDGELCLLFNEDGAAICVGEVEGPAPGAPTYTEPGTDLNCSQEIRANVLS